MFCNEFADRWKEIDEIEEDHQKMIKIKETLKELPDEHNKNIAYLFKMLPMRPKSEASSGVGWSSNLRDSGALAAPDRP